MKEKEELFQKRILELARAAYDRDVVTFSDFLDMNEQHIVHSMPSQEAGVSLEWYGGYEWSERQMIAFLPDALSYEWDYPIECLHIQPKSLKYTEELTHRDFLGALLNLGVLRGKIGDIIVREDFSAWVFCEEKMSEFFRKELTRVKHTQVLTEKVTKDVVRIAHREEEIAGTVASVRLDSLIALAFRTSRSQILPFIEGGKVFVNGKMVVSNGHTPKEGDVISVRGKGKFRFGDVQHKTKKGRLLVRVFRYV